MQYRRLGQSDLNVPVVSFGAWAIGGWMWGGVDGASDAAAIRAMQRGIEEGVTMIDTAPTYGMGHSETLVGKAIKGRRDKVIVATKCGVRWDLEGDYQGFDSVDNSGKPVKIVRHLGPDSVRYEVEQSLRRLDIDCIDLYQCHWPDPLTPIADTMEALLDTQRQGKIRHIGVSNFTPAMMDECRAAGVTLVSDQPKYNPLERDIEKDVLPYCLKHRIGVLAYSPIAQGLMTGKVTPDRVFKPGDHRADKPWFQPHNLKRILAMLEDVKPIAEAHGATLGQIAIAWVVAQPGITSALVGARTEAQVIENAKAGAITLTPQEIQTIRKLVEDLGAPA